MVASFVNASMNSQLSPALRRVTRTFHKDELGEEVQFSLVDESMGTRAAFGLLGFCLVALHSRKTLVIDEIDSSLHSLLVAATFKVAGNGAVDKVLGLWKTEWINQRNGYFGAAGFTRNLL